MINELDASLTKSQRDERTCGDDDLPSPGRTIGAILRESMGRPVSCVRSWVELLVHTGYASCYRGYSCWYRHSVLDNGSERRRLDHYCPCRSVYPDFVYCIKHQLTIVQLFFC